MDDPEFKEDSVREELITPVLKRLGYKSYGRNRIVRSRRLSHPFVNIGSKTHKISIIPDYILEVNGTPLVVLDAKSPHTSLEKSKHAEQAYSYAIHPEIRARVYILCNGWEWIIWNIDNFTPIARIKTSHIISNFSIIEKYLRPDIIARLNNYYTIEKQITPNNTAIQIEARIMPENQYSIDHINTNKSIISHNSFCIEEDTLTVSIDMKSIRGSDISSTCLKVLVCLEHERTQLKYFHKST